MWQLYGFVASKVPFEVSWETRPLLQGYDWSKSYSDYLSVSRSLYGLHLGETRWDIHINHYTILRVKLQHASQVKLKNISNIYIWKRSLDIANNNTCIRRTRAVVEMLIDLMQHLENCYSQWISISHQLSAHLQFMSDL